MKDHLSTSGIKDSKGYEALRTRLDDLGCSVEFLVMDVASHVSVDETLHRRILSELYDRIIDDQRKWHRKVFEALPPANYSEPTMLWNVVRASGHALSSDAIFSFQQTESLSDARPSLYEDFCNSLYLGKQRIERAEIQSLFSDWLDGLGIRDQSGIVVLNWTDAFELPASNDTAFGFSTTWTGFFCRGSLHQHGRCLTIWNPVCRTLAALTIGSPIHE
ncbi:hypothetical protein [Pseudomonas zeae]|uniref:Uncharacterized protein n=1 Tax=Pseudomonas zeae TaxID=2745510 RepID=A0A9E6NJI0_9PSED|nr:hypothetical protein [Pseudomonas zeae]QXI09195.1 hypothetical protein HU754_015160 [Pseudomonas zeae]